MASRNPLTRITHAAQGAAALPLKATEKVAEQAVGVVASGVRVASSLIYSTAERAKSMAGIEDEKTAPAPTEAPEARTASRAPGPVTAPPAEPLESVEALAEAAVAREMAEEPQPTVTPSKAARATAPSKATRPKKSVDEPLIDPAVAKAVKSETDTLRAAADLNPDQ